MTNSTPTTINNSADHFNVFLDCFQLRKDFPFNVVSPLASGLGLRDVIDMLEPAAWLVSGFRDNVLDLFVILKQKKWGNSNFNGLCSIFRKYDVMLTSWYDLIATTYRVNKQS